jgi:hypothetical protein
MSLEATVTYIGDLNVAWPTPDDPKAAGDDHIRNLKKALRDCFPGFAGAVLLGGVDTGAANACVLTPATPLPGYVANMMVVFKAAATNTSQAPTLNVSGLGAKSILDVSGNPVLTGDIPGGQYVALVYDGAAFRLAGITKNYVDQLSFKSVLPAQAGNKSKFLRTDGQSAFWDAPGISAVTATATDSVTLDAAFLLVPVQMAAQGKSIILPSAATLTLGGPQFVIDNSKGMFPVGIRDNAGTLLMAVTAGGVAFVSLKDNSTAAGGWLVTGMGLEPGMITGDVLFSSTYGTTLFPAFVVMDANTSVHFAALASGYAAFVVDNMGKVVSTPVTVDTASGQQPLNAYRIDATRLIVFTASKAVVISLTGASPTYSLSVGVLAAISTPALYLVLSGATVMMSVSVSGTTVTPGTSLSLGIPSAGEYAIYSLTTTTAVVVFLNNSSNLIGAFIATVNGVTTTASAPSYSTVNSLFSSTCQLSATKLLILVGNGTGSSASVLAMTVSGGAITFGALSQTIGAANAATAYSNINTRFNPPLLPIGPNSALLTYVDGTASRAVVVNENANTVSFGPLLSGSFTGGFVAAETMTDFVAITNVGPAGNVRFNLTPHKVNGVAVTLGAAQQIPEIPVSTTINTTPVARLPQGDYLVLAPNAQAIPVYRSNGDLALKRGAIAVPPVITPTTQPLLVVAPNRLLVLGAFNSQLRLLNIEVAA